MEPKELWNMLKGDQLYTDSFEQFMQDYGTPEGQNELWGMLSGDKLYTESFEQFQKDYFPVKKKSSTKASGALPPYFSKPSATKQPVRTAGGKSEKTYSGGLVFDWGTGSVEQDELPPVSLPPDTSGETEQPNPYNAALESLVSRRGMNFDDDAATVQAHELEAARRKSRSPLEKQTLEQEKLTLAEAGVKDNPFAPFEERATQAEFEALARVLGNENAEIELALEGLRLSSIYENDPESYAGQIAQLEELHQKNIDRFRQEMATGRYKTVEDLQQFFQERQKEADKAQKEGTGVGNVARSGGRIVLHSSAKLLKGVSNLTDMVEKSLGLEGDTPGAGDLLQEFAANVTDDVTKGFPAPTNLQRGVFTDTAKWGDYQVDFDGDGNIESIRDKDGYLADVQPDAAQEAEIKKLPKQNRFNRVPFAYQAGQTIGDVMSQVAGTKGIGSLRVPVVGASRMGLRFGSTPIGATTGLVAANTGLMAGDLYDEAKNAGLSDEDAARYALLTGTAIGIAGAKLGIGAEERLLFGKAVKSFGGKLAAPVDFAKRFVVGGAGEMGEEALLENAITSASQVAMNELAGGNFKPEKEWAINKLATEAALGFIAGGVISSIGKKPNKIQVDAMMEASRDVPAAMKEVVAVAEAIGEPLTEEQQASVQSSLEEMAKVREKMPEAQHGNTEAVEAMVDKVRVDEQIEQKKKEIKGVDPSLTQDTRDEIAQLEQESAKLSLSVSEAAGVKPDEKAVKAVMPETEEVSVSTEGAVKEAEVEEVAPSLAEPKPVKEAGKFVLEPPSGKKAATEYAEQNIDNIASLPEVDTQGLPEEQAAQKIIEEGSPAQVAALWRSLPDTDNPLDGPNGRSFAIRSAVSSQKFSDEGLGRGRFSTRELTGVRRRFGGGTMSPAEFAESLSDSESGDFLGIGEITEEDVFEALEANKNKGTPSVKSVSNPVKKAAAKRLSEMLGTRPSEEYVDRLIERSGFFVEREAVVAEFPQAQAAEPIERPNAGRMEKSFMRRVVEDVTQPLELRQAAEAGEMNYDVLRDEYVSDVAEQEINEVMSRMDFAPAMQAVRAKAEEILKESVTEPNRGLSETMGATAMAMLLKARHHLAEQGMIAEALEFSNFIDSTARNFGRTISIMRGGAIAEGVAGNAMMKVFGTQVRELTKRGKNKTLQQMLDDLRKEVLDARNSALSDAKKSVKAPEAKQPTAKKKENIRQERSAVIDSIKAKWQGMQNIGIGFDPEEQARKQAELIADVAKLIRTFVEEGIVNVQELFNAAVETLRGVGIEGPEPVVKEALLVLYEPVKSETSPLAGEKSQQQPLMDVPLRGTVSPEQIAALAFKDIPSGQQQPLMETAPSAPIENEIERIVDEHYSKQHGMALWRELVAAGVEEPTARNYEKRLAEEISKKSRRRITDAITKWNKKLEEEAIRDIRLHRKEWRAMVDDIVDAASFGVLNEQGMNAAVASYFGFKKILPEDVRTIKEMATLITTPLQSNAVMRNGQVVGYQPVGQPAPPNTVLVQVEQVSPELKARREKRLDELLLEIEKRNEGLMHVLPNEMVAIVHIGALSGIQTWANVVEGTLTNMLPKLASLTLSSPLATFRAVQAFRRADARNWKTGFGLSRDAFVTNFSHLDSRKTMFDGQYTSAASLVEVGIVRGTRKYMDMLPQADGIDKVKVMAKLIASVPAQMYRLAFMPKMIDGMMTHPVAEYVRFIETWNAQAKDVKLADRVGRKFADRVAEYGQFTKKSWAMARSQAEAEIAGMKAAKLDVPIDFVDRRTKEIVYQNVRRWEVESAMMLTDAASLRGEMSGFVGVLYDAYRKWRPFGDAEFSPIARMAFEMPSLLFGMFARVAVMVGNVTWKYTPILPRIADLAISTATAKHPFAKFVGNERYAEYPTEMQLNKGWVKKNRTEITEEVLMQGIGLSVAGVWLFFDSFDLEDDDEGNLRLKLDPDRMMDISATLDDNPLSTEVGGRQRYTVRFRQDNGKWGTPIKYSLWLPAAPLMAVIGGITDDLTYRPEAMNERTSFASSVHAFMDVTNLMSELSFNNTAQTIKRFQQAQAKAAKSDDPGSELGGFYLETAARPFKAIQPGFMRDVVVNDMGANTEPMPKPVTPTERIMKDIFILDSYIKNERYDEFGNEVYRDSKTLKLMERASFHSMDFVQRNEKTRKNPEWQLALKYDGLVTPGLYYAQKSLTKKVGGEKKKITIEEAEQLGKLVAETKGHYLRKHYGKLDGMDKQELEIAFEKIHNFAVDYGKFKMGFSTNADKPELDFDDLKKSIESQIEKDEE